VRQTAVKVLLVSPLERNGLTGGQARAGTILSECLQQSERIELCHCEQPHSQLARNQLERGLQRLRHYLSFIRLMFRQRPGIVHFFCPCSRQAIYEKAIMGLLGQIFQAKTLINLRNDPLPMYTRSSALQQWIIRKAVFVHTGAICQYSDLKGFFIEEIGLDESRVFVMHNAVKPFRSDKVQWSAQQRFRARRVVFLGGLQPRKQVEVLLESLALLKHRPPILLDVIGDAQPPEYLSRLRQHACDQGVLDRVTFHGPLFGERKRVVLQQGSLLALPSLSEGFPNVSLEAAQLGLPVVLSSVGAAKDIKLAFRAGVHLVNAYDVGGFSHAIDYLLGNEETYQICSWAATKGAGRFSVDAMRDQVISAYWATLNN